MLSTNLNDKGTIEFKGYEVTQRAALNQKQDKKVGGSEEWLGNWCPRSNFEPPEGSQRAGRARLLQGQEDKVGQVVFQWSYSPITWSNQNIQKNREYT